MISRIFQSILATFLGLGTEQTVQNFTDNLNEKDRESIELIKKIHAQPFSEFKQSLPRLPKNTQFDSVTPVRYEIQYGSLDKAREMIMNDHEISTADLDAAKNRFFFSQTKAEKKGIASFITFLSNTLNDRGIIKKPMYRGYDDCVKELQKLSMDISSTPEYQLMNAIKHNDTEDIRDFISDPYVQPDKPINGLTVIDVAIIESNNFALGLLLQQQVDINQCHINQALLRIQMLTKNEEYEHDKLPLANAKLVLDQLKAYCFRKKQEPKTTLPPIDNSHKSQQAKSKTPQRPQTPFGQKERG